MANQDFTDKINRKENVGIIYYLINLYYLVNGVEYKVYFTNYNSKVPIIFKGNTYEYKDFVVILPEIGQDETQDIQIIFPKINDSYETELLDSNVYKLNLFIKSQDDTTLEFYEVSTFFKSQNESSSYDSSTYSFFFSKELLIDFPFPFRKYNRIDHPSLYIDSKTEEL